MSDVRQNAIEPAGPRGPSITLIAVLVVIIGSLSGIDAVLAKAERAEVQAEAARLYQEGTRLMSQHKDADAVESFRKAHVMVRTDPKYQVALVSALLADKRLDEAQGNLDLLLGADPNNGLANLLKARLSVTKERFAEAESYYHRAIYGSWDGDIAAHRLETRMELAQFLASRNEQKELLAELLLLETEAPDDPALRKTIAQLYVRAGSPGRAANVYRELLGHNPDDVESYRGLGQAELALGDYRAAEDAFSSAERRGPSDAAAGHLREIASTAASLDPTVRRLSSSEKFARSTRIAEMVRDALNRCQSSKQSSQDSQDAAKILAKPAPPHITNESAEARLALAEQLWKTALKTCGSGKPPGDEALRLIMSKLAQ